MAAFQRLHLTVDELGTTQLPPNKIQMVMLSGLAGLSWEMLTSHRLGEGGEREDLSFYYYEK